MSTVSFKRNRTHALGGYDVLLDGKVAAHVAKVPGYMPNSAPMWVATNLSGKISSDKEFTRKDAVDALARKVADAHAVKEALEEIVAAEPVTEQDKTEALQEELAELATELVHLTTEPGITVSKLADLRDRIEEKSHELEMALMAEQPAPQPQKRLQDARKAELTASSVARYLNRNGRLVSSPERQYRHEGVFCRQNASDRVSVHIDLDMPGHRQRVIDDLVEDLGTRYDVELKRTPLNLKELADGGESVIIYVTKKA